MGNNNGINTSEVPHFEIGVTIHSMTSRDICNARIHHNQSHHSVQEWCIGIEFNQEKAKVSILFSACSS
jgi:hypothetical protein